MAGLKLSLVITVLYLVNIIIADPIVKTDLGEVDGVVVKSILKNEQYLSFMGIPYGKAPVGPLRFKAPESHEGWTTVLNAKKEKPPCTNYNLPVRPIPNYGVNGNDDCLHLSIHTPKLPEEGPLDLPVVVFLYNEFFRIAYNASKEYGPDFFMKEDVILVTISHRLGASGFMSNEDDVLPGNNALRDVILALKWVQRNIQKFGGDVFNITLMGSRGGAVIVDTLLQSPKAKGLFSKAILQSGTSWQSSYFPKSAKEKTKLLMKQLEKPFSSSTSIIDNLSDISTGQLAEAEIMSVDANEGRFLQKPTISFGPTVEHEHPDAIITKLPEEEPINIDIPIMIGYNSREGLELMDRYIRKPEYLTFADRDYLFLFPTRNDYRFDLQSTIYAEAVQEIKDFYLEEGYVQISKPGEYMTYVGDAMAFYGIDYTVRNYLNNPNSGIYYYTFDYSGDLNLRKNELLKDAKIMEGTWGASTGDELCYLFVCKPIRKTYRKLLEEEDAEELQVLRNMVKFWTNFAKSGNPTPSGSDFIWTPASKENKECLVISDELKIKNNLHQDRIEYWDNFLVKYSALVVDGVVKDVKDEL